MCLGQGRDKRIIKVDGKYHTYIRFNTEQYKQNKYVYIIVDHNIIGKYKIKHITKINNNYSYHFSEKISYYKKHGVNILYDMILVSELKEYIKELDKSDLNKYKIYFNNMNGNKGILKFINKMINGGKNKKETAKKDEDIRVQHICDHINNKTKLGLKLIQEYYEQFDKEIDRVEKKGGKNIHFDIIIYHTDGTKYQCEEKGTSTYHENIDIDTVPWENSVEFYNGPANKFTISEKYLKIWYNINVNNIQVKQKYKLPDIPEYPDWLDGSPYCMYDPKIEYSIILKKHFREINGGESMGGHGKKNTDINYREKVNEKFKMEFNDTDEKSLIEEVQEIYEDVMNQKECWLQTTGNPQTNEFSFKWYKKIDPKIIKKVEIIDNPDILFKFTLDDDNSFNGHMRWGKGCGFSCFRMDLK